MLKKSGVIRKIDELGRIVIPKETRRMLGIREGENLEILVDNNEIILKKYNHTKSLLDLGIHLIDIYSTVSDNYIIITDREKVLASNFKNDLVDIPLNDEMIHLIDNREFFKENDKIIDLGEIQLRGNFVMCPIISDIDCLGLIILYSEKNNLIDDVKGVKLISKILSEKLNIN